MKTWTRPEPVIRYVISDSWSEEWLNKIIHSTNEELAEMLEEVAKEIWNEAYIKIDMSGWGNTEYAKIRIEADRQLDKIDED